MINNENIRNRNYQKTEEAIKQALIDLYKQKRNINRITVKELCEVANISRSTFYLHYNDLISIFESVGDQFVLSIKEMIMELIIKEEFNFFPYFETIFNSINESNELIKISLSSEYPLVYIDNIKDQLETMIINNPLVINNKFGQLQTLTEIRIVVSGIIDLIINLIKKNDKIDTKKYAEILNNFLVRLTSSLM